MTHSHNVFLDTLRTMGAPGLAGLIVAMTAIVLLCLGTILKALTADGHATFDRVLPLGLALGTLSYLAANQISDSMGPSTSPFFWTVFFLGMAARGRLMSEP